MRGRSLASALIGALVLLSGCASVNGTGAPDDGEQGVTEAAGVFNRLEEAIEAGRTHEVRAVLSIIGDVDAADSDGATALHYAAWQPGAQGAELVGFILAQGADPNVRRTDGHAPLHWAAYHGNAEAVDALIAAGADVNPRSQARATPLHWAVRRDHAETARRLIYHGADLDARMIDGTRPFDVQTDTAEDIRIALHDLSREYLTADTQRRSSVADEYPGLPRQGDYRGGTAAVLLRFRNSVSPQELATIRDLYQLFGDSVAQAVYRRGPRVFGVSGQQDAAPYPRATLEVPRTFHYTENAFVEIVVENSGRGALLDLTGTLRVDAAPAGVTTAVPFFVGDLAGGASTRVVVSLPVLGTAAIGEEIPLRVSWREAEGWIPPELDGRVFIEEIDNRAVQRHAGLFTMDDIRVLVDAGFIDRRSIDRLIHFDRLPYTVDDIKFFAERREISQDIVESVLVTGAVPYSNDDLLDIAQLEYLTRPILEALILNGRLFSRQEIDRFVELGVFRRPELRYTYLINDGDSPTSTGNRDGRLQVRESPDFIFPLKNNSIFDLDNVRVTIAAPQEGAEVFRGQRSRSFDGGETAELIAQIGLKPGFAGSALSVRLEAEHPIYGTLLAEELQVPVGREVGSRVISLNQRAVAARSVGVYSGADTSTPVITTVPAGAVFDVVGELDAFYKVSVFGRSGWVSKNLTEPYRETEDEYTLVSDIDEEERLFQNLRPEVVIRSPRNNDTIDHTRVQLELTAIDPAGGVQSIDVRVNGRRLTGSTARGLVVAGGARERVERSFEVPLREGRNEVRVVAYNTRNVASEEQRLILHSTGIRNPPRLFVLAVGVSDYGEDRWDLRYAAADAEAMGDLFGQQRGRLYEDVFTSVLTDEQATRAGIITELTQFVNRARRNDVVIVFLAGHGVTSNGLYYFVPHDASVDQPAIRGISRDELRTQLAYNMDATKSVVMLDTCQSGFLPGRRGTGPDMTRVIEELARAEGIVFLSASRGNQAALEQPEWGHGAFTLAVREALEQRRVDDWNDDGVVHIGELYDYVADRVFDITGGEQKPQMNESIEFFPLFALD